MSGDLTSHGAVEGKAPGAVVPFPRQVPPGPDWFSVEIHGDTAHVKIFGEIGLHGQRAEDLLAQIANVENVNFTILDCIGGCGLAALLLHDGLDGCTVTCDIIGRCFSAGILVALSAGQIRIAESARLMVHTPRAWLFADEAELTKAAEQIRLCKSRIRAMLMARLFHDLGSCVDHWLSDGQDHFFTAVQAKAIGLADEVFTLPAETNIKPTADTLPPRRETDDEILFRDFLRAFGRIEVFDRAGFIRNLNAWAVHNVTK
jgi:ATP-dependent protease ClpP protease subunit